MTYEMRCPKCGTTEEYNVPVAKRDGLFCKCGTKLVNVTAPTKQILIPCGFYTTRAEREA